MSQIALCTIGTSSVIITRNLAVALTQTIPDPVPVHGLAHVVEAVVLRVVDELEGVDAEPAAARTQLVVGRVPAVPGRVRADRQFHRSVLSSRKGVASP